MSFHTPFHKQALLSAPSGEPADTLCQQLQQRCVDWTKPTTAQQRMSDAVTLLCAGKRPPDDMVAGWLDRDAEDGRLQEFAIEHGPAWCQGIALLDAAQAMVDQPTEGVAHEHAEPQAAPVPARGDLAPVLRELEDACDARAALLTQDAYLLLEAIPGMTAAIIRLDDARRAARQALASPPAAAAPEPVATVGDLIIQVRERVTARGILNSAPLYSHPAPAVAATVQALTDALRMIAWSNDSAWQAQCAREALEAHGIATPAAPKEQQ